MQSKNNTKLLQPSPTAIGQRKPFSANSFHLRQPLAEPSAGLLPLISHADTKMKELVTAAMQFKAGSKSPALAQHIDNAVVALYDCYMESPDAATITHRLNNLRKSAIAAHTERGMGEFRLRVGTDRFRKIMTSHPGFETIAKTVITLVAEQEADALVQVVLFSLGGRVATVQATTFVNTIQSSLSALAATERVTEVVAANIENAPSLFHLLSPQQKTA